MSQPIEHNTEFPYYGYRKSQSRPGQYWPVCSCGHRFRRTFAFPGHAQMAAKDHARDKAGGVA